MSGKFILINSILTMLIGLYTGCEKEEPEQKLQLMKIEVLTVIMDSTYRDALWEFYYDGDKLERIKNSQNPDYNYNLYYNSEGRLTSFWEYSCAYQDNRIYRITGNSIAPIRLEYDGHGRLAKKYQEGHLDYYQLYFYDNRNNITKVEVYERDELSTSKTASYTHDQHKNPLNVGGIVLNIFLDLGEMDGIYRTTAFTNPNNIVSAQVPPQIKHTYEYTYNEDDYPVTFTIKGANGETILSYVYTYY